MSDSGVCSRRKAGEYISGGKGKGQWQTLQASATSVFGRQGYNLPFDGEKYMLPRKDSFIDIMPIKPRGYVTTMSDELDRKCKSNRSFNKKCLKEFILLADLTRTQRDC